jgi:hypothetical protein
MSSTYHPSTSLGRVDPPCSEPFNATGKILSWHKREPGRRRATGRRRWVGGAACTSLVRCATVVAAGRRKAAEKCRASRGVCVAKRASSCDQLAGPLTRNTFVARAGGDLSCMTYAMRERNRTGSIGRSSSEMRLHRTRHFLTRKPSARDLRTLWHTERDHTLLACCRHQRLHGQITRLGEYLGHPIYQGSGAQRDRAGSALLPAPLGPMIAVSLPAPTLPEAS